GHDDHAFPGPISRAVTLKWDPTTRSGVLASLHSGGARSSQIAGSERVEGARRRSLCAHGVRVRSRRSNSCELARQTGGKRPVLVEVQILPSALLASAYTSKGKGAELAANPTRGRRRGEAAGRRRGRKPAQGERSCRGRGPARRLAVPARGSAQSRGHAELCPHVSERPVGHAEVVGGGEVAGALGAPSQRVRERLGRAWPCEGALLGDQARGPEVAGLVHAEIAEELEPVDVGVGHGELHSAECNLVDAHGL